MSSTSFNVPSLESMNALLPAFDFKTLIASDESGAVYLCNQRSLERDVAIKILAPELSLDPVFRQRFEDTARSMAKLNHPNLISIFDSGCVDGMLYFVMEFVPGKSLEHSAHGQLIEFRQTTQLLTSICAGLAHAHQHGIVHGSLNLANVLLNQKAEPKIGNFGFTHSARESLVPEFPQFIAPEVLVAPASANHLSDIHSLGASLYQLLTGQPHHPDSPPPSSFTNCGTGVDDIWKQATAADPSQRFPDVESFQKKLTATRPPPPASKLAVKKPAAPAANHPAPSPPANTPLPKAKVGMNWKLIRNLVIIAGLLYAINIAWESRKKATTQRELENREIIAKSAKDKENALAAAQAHQAELRAKATTKLTIPEPVIQAESPAASLARLRQNLAAGKRSEMPTATILRGENQYLLVSQPMTWMEAARFAEEHGAHLAVPNSEADLTWLVANLPSDQGTWIGAAASGRNSWTLADASPWKPAKTPSGTGQFVAADKHGFLRAENAQTLLPFILQWHKDGSNPGTLAACLTATRNTLTQPEPTYPPGTRVFGTRHYLFVPRPVSWNEALQLAESAGGNLIAATDIREISNLEEMTNDLTAYPAIWLGAFLKDDQWLWITGEPWKTAKWANSSATAQPDSALVITPRKGWDTLNRSEHAAGFIIEWSSDPKTPGVPTPAPVVAGGDVAALSAKAKELLTSADTKRSQDLAANVKKLNWDLDVFIRGLNKSDQSMWSPHVGKLKAAIKNNRLPSAIPKSSGISLSEQMAKLAQFHSLKQDKIDLVFAADAEKIRLAFTKKISDAKSQATQSGQRKLAESLDESLQDAANLDLWLHSLGIELQPVNTLSSTRAATPNSTPANPAIGGTNIE